MLPLGHTPTSVLGCDVGKTSIAIFNTRTGRSQVIENEPTALATLAASLDPHCLAVCEATGGFEASLLIALARAGIAVHRADPRRVKAFIRSLGTLGKSDAIDARALARYGQERHASLRRWQPTDAACDQLHALVTIRRELVATHTSWRNRAGAPGAAEAFLVPLIAAIEGQLTAIETAITDLIEANAALADRVARLRSIPGIGATTAAALVALMPELGSLDRRQAASLAGLAPHPRQSGSHDGYRRVRGGRPEVKRALFMAAMTASRHHPTLSRFHQRLLARGKKPLVALVAVMRKLLVLCNAVLREAHA